MRGQVCSQDGSPQGSGIGLRKAAPDRRLRGGVEIQEGKMTGIEETPKATPNPLTPQASAPSEPKAQV